MARLFIVVHAVRALAVVLVFAAAGFAQDVARMELLVQSLTPDNRFMGTALVARGENILLSKGYGSASARTPKRTSTRLVSRSSPSRSGTPPR